MRFPRLLAYVLMLAGAAPALAEPRPVVVASGLENPWAVAFLPSGRFLVTEKLGRMRVVEADGKVGPALPGLPQVAIGGQGGLLDVVLDSGFETNRTLYFCFSEADGDADGRTNSTALAKAQLSTDRARIENVRVIFSQRPKVASRNHFGCRIAEGKDGNLYMTTGERFSRKEDAQKLDSHLGKIIRVTMPKARTATCT